MNGKNLISGENLYSESEALVLDSSAFITGVNPLNLEMKLFTTPEVIGELSSIWLQFKYSTAIQLKKLNVVTPKECFLRRVENMSRETGDRKKLSKADLSVLALALELSSRGFKPSIVSDDYSIQNVAEHLKIDYKNLAIKKIKSRIKWVWYCPACQRRFSLLESHTICPVCGGKIKRKALEKFNLKT